jgi:protein-S-isoprenylcysteine O-methyltransferase Ste14
VGRNSDNVCSDCIVVPGTAAMTIKTMLRGLIDQLLSLLLPFIVLVLIPFLVERNLEIITVRSQGMWPFIMFSAGLILMVAGLAGIALTVGLFIHIGKGTLAPWSPPKRLVVTGPYAYVRNPMITSVVAVLLGEALFFGSWRILAWAVLVFVVNHLYFILSEEPGLARRFGEEYGAYKRNVPRWLPRLVPWRPGGK